MASKKGCLCALIVLFSLLICCCVALMIGLGYVYARPYILSLGLESAECTVTNSRKTGRKSCPTCDNYADPEFAQSTCSYECLVVEVEYSRGSGRNVWPGTIFENLEQEGKANGRDNVQEITSGYCSISSCNRIYDVNAKRVEDFRLLYGNIGNKYTCWYDPDDTTFGPIIFKQEDWWPTFHSLVWPGAGLLICIVLLIVTVCYRKRLDKW